MNIGSGTGKSKRYSEENKLQVLEYRKTHTIRETASHFGVANGAIYRWAKKAALNMPRNGNGHSPYKKRQVVLPVQIHFCPNCGTRIPNAYAVKA